ncbi:hypothetical protein HMI55_004747 [Coelomomyces lativittatus]|nr:hypothetical protein HMI55_004747 [Coelomomyces lativittatus]
MVSIVVIAETTRSSFSNKRKEAIQNQRLSQLELDVKELKEQLEQLKNPTSKDRKV